MGVIAIDYKSLTQGQPDKAEAEKGDSGGRPGGKAEAEKGDSGGRPGGKVEAKLFVLP